MHLLTEEQIKQIDQALIDDPESNKLLYPGCDEWEAQLYAYKAIADTEHEAHVEQGWKSPQQVLDHIEAFEKQAKKLAREEALREVFREIEKHRKTRTTEVYIGEANYTVYEISESAMAYLKAKYLPEVKGK